MKPWLGLAGAAALVAGAIGPGWFRAAEWPTIPDPAALRREATVLCRQEGGWRELSPGQYPAAMIRLHPASISVSAQRVYLGLVPVPGGPRYHGYYIWPDTTDRKDGGIVREDSRGGPPGT